MSRMLLLGCLLWTTSAFAAVVDIVSPADGVSYAPPASFTVTSQAIPDADEDGERISSHRIERNSTVIATGISQNLSASVTGLAAGVYWFRSFAVTNRGQSVTSGLIKVTVAVPGANPPTVSIGTPSGAPFTAPATVGLSATASDSDGSVAKVEFLANGAVKGSDTTSPYAYSWSNAPVGTHSLTAKAYDNSGNTTTSAPVSISVAHNPPSVTLGAPTGGPFLAPAIVNLSATASDPDGTIARVEFHVDGVLKGSDTTSPYAYAWSNVAEGSYSVVAKAFDNHNNSTASSAFGVYVASRSRVRTYTYNAYKQLCRIVEPETGATLLGYDAAGNLAWSAAGLPEATPCDLEGDTPAISARSVLRLHDARNRLKQLSFPDTRGDQSWTYTPDGLPWQVHTTNVPGTMQTVNTYAYNKRRKLVTETVLQGEWFTFSLGYGYDGNGHLASQSYPSGQTVRYAPNGLGQATRVEEVVPVGAPPRAGLCQRRALSPERQHRRVHLRQRPALCHDPERAPAAGPDQARHRRARSELRL